VTTRDIVELLVAGTMPIGLAAIMWQRISTKTGIGVRVIQFVGVVLGLPAIILLGFEKVLEGQTVAALIAGVLGYLLSGISQYDSERTSDKGK